MPSEKLHLELRCTSCSFRTHCGPQDMIQWLEQSGMARRAKGLPPHLLSELFQSASGSFRCPKCNAPGMAASPADEQLSDENWGMQRLCQKCRQPISSERLDLLPDAQLCAACQSVQESGQEEADYCPRCGAVRKLRQTARRDTSRYAMRCPACGFAG